MWRPQDIVAIILTVGIVLVLLSETDLTLLWLTPEELAVVSKRIDDEVEIEFWKDILNVILGALAGYIAGRSKND